MAEDNVAARNPEYDEMAAAWELPDDLRGGTAAMKSAGKWWLAKNPKEEMGDYKVRLSRATLVNFYATALRELSGKPFSKPVSINEPDKLPEKIKGMPNSMDDEGRNITQVSQEILKIGINRGLCHVLTDYPTIPAGNLGEEQSLGIRPFCVVIDPIDVIGWTSDKRQNGEKYLTQVRIRENVVMPEGQYTSVVKQRIRVIYPDHWELWENKKEAGDIAEEWSLLKGGPWSIGRITLRTLYLRKTGFMTGRPVLEDMAYLNLSHYQIRADLMNTLKFAGTGLIWSAGLSKEDQVGGIIWGLHHHLAASNENAKFGILQLDGSSIEATRNVLSDTVQDIGRLALKPMIVKAWGNETAMGKAIDEGKGNCDLQAWVRRAEETLRNVLVDAAEWVGQELPDEVGVDIYDDFGLSERSAEDLNWMLKAYMADTLSKETLLSEAKMRGVLAETLDVVKELERIRQEGPDLGMVGLENDGK